MGQGGALRDSGNGIQIICINFCAPFYTLLTTIYHINVAKILIHFMNLIVGVVIVARDSDGKVVLAFGAKLPSYHWRSYIYIYIYIHTRGHEQKIVYLGLAF